MRKARISKSTMWASNSGPSTQAKRGPLAVMTRQPPHMPVPSTISVFKLTMVGMAGLRVASATACIMRTGPTANTRSRRRPLARASNSGSTTNPRRPALPSSVIRISSSQAARISVSKINCSRERAPSTPMTRFPAARSADATGRMIAVPTPPAIAMTVPNRRTSVGWPSGPATSRIASPAASELSSFVVLPTP